MPPEPPDHLFPYFRASVTLARSMFSSTSPGFGALIVAGDAVFIDETRCSVAELAAVSCGVAASKLRPAGNRPETANNMQNKQVFTHKNLFGYTVLSARKSRFMSVLMQLDGGAVSPL